MASRELFGYGTTIDLLYGVFAPPEEFDEEAPKLLDCIDSIRLMNDYFCMCFDCAAYGCDRQCRNGCCNEPCYEFDRCRELE